MITLLITALIWLLVLGVVYWIVRLAASHFQVPVIFVQIIGLVLFLIWLLYVLKLAGVGIG